MMLLSRLSWLFFLAPLECFLLSLSCAAAAGYFLDSPGCFRDSCGCFPLLLDVSSFFKLFF